MISSPNGPWNGPADKVGIRIESRFDPYLPSVVLLSSLIAGTASCFGGTEDALAVSGQLKLSADYALDRHSARENPELAARLILDDQRTAWNLHAWIEGTWELNDGDQRGTACKYFDSVYESEPRPFDAKELFAERKAVGIDWRIGVQRFSWGRLDEYPINDLFNPWDYDQFIIKPMEERKVGVPAVSAGFGGLDWSAQLVWVPWFVPYRLPSPESRWAMTATDQEPDLPARTLDNGAFGVRVQWMGEIESALSFFHGYDPRPVFERTLRSVTNSNAGWNGYDFVPTFHKITSVGMDAAIVIGPVSLRGETAWTGNRVFNIHPALWNDSDLQSYNTGGLSPIERECDTLDYGLAADYRPFEDGLLTIQAQQTAMLSRPDSLYERQIETLLWVNLKVDWLNQKIETHCNLAHNPEHGASMIRAGVTYVFTDSWKTNLTAVILSGPPQSLFGRYAMNDQIRLELVYQW
ncbi:MAG: hypothetical protein PHI97_26335 [Desulfobulbus sp.]|nr:hypothetical protein [Desulfobulbus sp.]